MKTMWTPRCIIHCVHACHGNRNLQGDEHHALTRSQNSLVRRAIGDVDNIFDQKSPAQETREETRKEAEPETASFGVPAFQQPFGATTTTAVAKRAEMAQIE